MKKKKGWEGFLFVLPDLLGVMVFVLLPFLDMLKRSCMDAIGKNWVGFRNYRTIFANDAFRLAAGNTLRFTFVCVPLLLILSLLIALALLRQKRIGSMLKSMFLFPMAIPVASVVLMWKVMFAGKGLLNGMFHFLQIETVDFMNTGAVFGVLVFSYIWRNLGYDVVLCLSGLSAIPEAQYEAARVDGAGEIRCFFSITLPNFLPSLYTITVLSLLNTFKVFREAYLVAGDYPPKEIYLMQHLFNNWFREMSFDKMAAGAAVNAAVFFLLVCMLRHTWEKGDD